MREQLARALRVGNTVLRNQSCEMRSRSTPETNNPLKKNWKETRKLWFHPFSFWPCLQESFVSDVFEVASLRGRRLTTGWWFP